MSPFKHSISLLLLTLSTLGSTIQAQELDLVLLGGRVMDPETGLDATRNVGIADGTVAVITEDDIRGRDTIDATGLVAVDTGGQEDSHRRLRAARQGHAINGEFLDSGDGLDAVAMCQ